MGSPKALLDIAGETFLDRLIALFEARCSPVIVVLGPTPDEFARASRTREAIFVFESRITAPASPALCNAGCAPFRRCGRRVFYAGRSSGGSRFNHRRPCSTSPRPLIRVPRFEGRARPSRLVFARAHRGVSGAAARRRRPRRGPRHRAETDTSMSRPRHRRRYRRPCRLPRRFIGAGRMIAGKAFKLAGYVAGAASGAGRGRALHRRRSVSASGSRLPRARARPARRSESQSHASACFTGPRSAWMATAAPAW